MTIASLDVLNKEIVAKDPARPLTSVEGKLLGKRTPGHIPALDGLRGIAVLLVLFCHATQRPFHDDCNGFFHGPIDGALLFAARVSWVGVDLFFVLSGFLITGILFDAKGKDRFFTNFYARRTVRIFPLYYACLALFFLVFPLLGTTFNQGMGGLTSHKAWYWLYLSNYAQAYQENLGHGANHIAHVSWTLSIEEQFYLCWPLVVFLFNRKTLLKITAGMFVGALLLRTLFVLQGKTYWALGFTPCRVDGLALGAAIALIARGPLGLQSLTKYAKFALPLSIAGLGATIVAMKAMHHNEGVGQTPGAATIGTTLYAILFGSMLVLAAAAAPKSWTAWLFELPILRIFGKYSYACYLFHMPVMILLAEHIPALNPARHPFHNLYAPALIVFYVASFAATLGVSIVSWNVLEKHCLKLKKFFPMENHESAVART